MKRVFIFLLVFALISGFAACGKSESGSEKSNAAEGGKTAVSETATQKTIEPKKKKPVEEDDDLGLMNVKIQETEGLSDIEKLLVKYFDNDYFYINSYADLQRHPLVFRGAEIEIYGKIVKTIVSNDDKYEFLFQMIDLYDNYLEGGNEMDKYLVIKGEQQESRLIEGDEILVFGQYFDIDSYVIDGKTYNVPTVVVNKYTFDNREYDYETDTTSGSRSMMFSMTEIRDIAKYFFGDDLTIHESNKDDIKESSYSHFDFEPGQAYTVEIENQSNANFTKYLFYADYGGYITDLKNFSSQEFRTITVSADFSCFYLQIENFDLNTYTLSCYNRQLNKMWTREFDETTQAAMDYTANHIYMLVNGYLYILDAETGEDAIERKFVGEKTDIQKVKDGIFLMNQKNNTTSDVFMKTDLSGNVLWTANSKIPLDYSKQFQIVNGNYVIMYYGHDMDGVAYAQFAVVLSPEGDVLHEIVDKDYLNSGWEQWT